MKKIDSELKILADSTDICCTIWDENFEPIYFNDVALHFFNISQEFKEEFKILNKDYERNVIKTFSEGICSFLWTKDENINCRVQMSKISFKNHFYVLCYTSQNCTTIIDDENKFSFTQKTFEHMPIACVFFDMSSNKVKFNKESLVFFGEENIFCGMKDFQKNFPKQQPNGKYSDYVYSEYLTKARQGEPQKFRFKFEDNDGEDLYSLVYLVPVKDGDFSVVAFIKRIYIEEEEFDLESYIYLNEKLIYDLIPLGCNFWNEKLEIVYCNKASMQIFGYSDFSEYSERLKSAVHKNHSEISTPSDVYGNLQRALKGEIVEYEGWYNKKNSEKIYIKVVVMPVFGRKNYKLVSFFIDLTRQKSAEALMEKAVKEKELANKRMKIMLDNAPLSIMLWDSDQNILDYNSHAINLFGKIDEDKLLNHYCDFFPEKQPDGRNSLEVHKEILEYAFTHDESSQEIFQFMKADGSLMDVEVTFARIAYENKYVVISYKKDLTKEKETLKSKIDADKRILSMIEHSPIASNVWTSDYKVIDCNNAFLKMIEVKDKKVYFKDRARFSLEYQSDGILSRTKLMECVDRTFSDGYCKMEWIYKTSNGLLVPTEINAVRVTFSTSVLIVTYIRDLRDIQETMKRLNELEQYAYTDALTGIYNRRYFMEYGDNEITNSIKNFTIIMFDIDHFKNVNDSYGHDVGDEVLKHVTNIIISNLRESDIFARYGGEEFLVLCHNAKLEKIISLSERIRKTMEKSKYVHSGVGIVVTISIGIAKLDRTCDSTIDDVIKKADKALYEAKNSGRNKVCIY